MTEDPDRDLVAAEYVLGLLDGADRKAVEAQIESDATLAAAIAAWSTRLEPLASLPTPAAPSDMLWARIHRDLPRPRGMDAHVSRRSAPWRGLALASAGLAACLAVALSLSDHRVDVHVALDAAPRPTRVAAEAPPAHAPPTLPTAPSVATASAPAPRVAPPIERSAVALLTATGADRPAMKAFLRPDKTIRLTAIRPVDVPPGKALGFWVWPRGTGRPILVGRMPSDGGVLRFPYGAEDGTPVMVTLEPRDLPYTGVQGPTLFQGEIVLLN